MVSSQQLRNPHELDSPDLPQLIMPVPSFYDSTLRTSVLHREVLVAVAEFTLKDEILAEVNERNWVHSIDLGHGIVTPGAWGDHNPLLWEAFRSIDFRGKKVLDIGCWDGLFSFEAEKLGAAQVYATDYIVHRHTQKDGTFELAAKVLGSRAIYHPKISVYDIESLGRQGL